MKPLRLRPLHPNRAQALVEALGRHDEESELRALRQELESLLGKAARRAPARPSKLPPVRRPKPASGEWGTKALRWAVWERAEGRCECGCGRRITWDGPEKFNMDHILGRARAPQSPENVWALSIHCDTERTLNRPSRRYWLQRFLLHAEAHGFGSSETARGIRDELAAEEQLQQAQLHAARAVEQAENLAGRARRAKGAADASE